MEYTLNRVWTLAALAALAAALALVLGFPMAAAGVAAGLPVGIVNYLMMFSVGGGWRGGHRQGGCGAVGAALDDAAAAVGDGAFAGVAAGPGVPYRRFDWYRHGNILVLQRRDPDVHGFGS